MKALRFAGAALTFAAVAVSAAGCRGRGARQDHAEHALAAPSAAPLTAHDHGGHDVGRDAGPPAGYAPVTLQPEEARTLGMQAVEVSERDIARTVRTVGMVVVDETRTAHVHAKVRGWVDTIFVNFVGKAVRTGDPLCAIYSQDVYAAELEFLSVLDRVRVHPPPAGEFAQAEQAAQDQLLAAARRRLTLWDVPKAEIDRLEATREAKRTFTLLAPRPGVVVDKQALDGMYVDPSVELYTLSDLSRVWVQADLYEADAPFVHVGDTAMLTVEGTPDPIHAKVVFLAPTFDEATRTLKARFELANADGKLRPGAFVNVVMDLGARRGLVVPESAVIRTGTRSIVFVVHGGAGENEARHLEPREIKTGALTSGFYRVDAGLAPGERVATGAQFLLDSESRLRATGGGGHGGHAGH